MSTLFASTLPQLPLLLWETPPGLELILAQEGIAASRVRDPHPLAFRGGRFVLYDGRRVSPATVRATLTPDHVALDIDPLRREDGGDPFAALIDNRGALKSWRIGGATFRERVGLVPKAAIRRRLIPRLQHAIGRGGGIWARLSAFPFPHRSAFNLRVDLDEPAPADYARFAAARRGLEDCCTHFVSTHAYGGEAGVHEDLRRVDAQSHGHYHTIYRDREANRRNLRRAHEILEGSGIRPAGFAAPHGRWNAGLDEALEGMGYRYSSDFQVGYDDLPFFPWRGGGFSRVLQVPVHPICEGLFLDQGVEDGRAIARYYAATVRAKIEAGEPAFVYGHPERRLCRFPEVLAALRAEIEGEPFLWRTTLTGFADWWRWRAERRWSIVPKAGGRLEVQFEDWRPDYPLGLEIVRGRHVSTVPVTGPRMTLRLEDLAYERREFRLDLPVGLPTRGPIGLKAAVRAAIDWETATPLADLPSATLSDRVKRGLRWWRERSVVGASR